MRGTLIVIEGLDGSGKATQSDLLYTYLKKRGMAVKKVSFPCYKSESSALVKMYLRGDFGENPGDVNAYAASSFYAVDRYASYKRDWKEFLESGGIVIADRYTTSNAVHQCSKLPKEQWDTFLGWLSDYEYQLLRIPVPTITIYLRVDPEVSQKLLRERYQGDESRKDIHEKDVAYLLRSGEAAEYCVEKFGWKVIECCEDEKMRSIGEIQEEINGIVETAVGKYRGNHK